MHALWFVVLGLAGCAILAGIWFGWQLLRQNGRILLRFDELEKRLNELQFGGADEPSDLPLDSVAPDFELPDLAGGTKSLAQFRGQAVLLIFFNPACGFCREMLPKLAAMPPHPQPLSHPMGEGGPAVAGSAEGLPLALIISTGGADANRQLLSEHQVTFPVLIQKESEVATAYLANGTPSGYLVSAEGKIASELAMGAEALLRMAKGDSENGRGNGLLSPALSSRGGEGEDARAERFKERSLVRSKIKRDGLKAGAVAPDFRLPRLDGRGELALSELRGRRVLLVFSSPGCGPCDAMAPKLEEFHRGNMASKRSPSPQPSPPGEGESLMSVQVVMISKGEPKENRAKVKEHGLTFPVVLQQQWEISRRYAMFATPIAYLIDEEGVITRDVAVGTEAIQGLFVAAAQQTHEEAVAAN